MPKPTDPAEIKSDPEGTECQQDMQDMDSSTLGETPSGHRALDPTRYGDWEKNGRCIDF